MESAQEQQAKIDQAVRLLPPEIQEQVREFIESLLKEQYTSVELQHKVTDDLVATLYGSWGQGTWEEYQPDIEWARFSEKSQTR